MLPSINVPAVVAMKSLLLWMNTMDGFYRTMAKQFPYLLQLEIGIYLVKVIIGYIKERHISLLVKRKRKGRKQRKGKDSNCPDNRDSIFNFCIISSVFKNKMGNIDFFVILHPANK